MRREEKYPDTSTFHFYNANPKGRITTDCVIRAISKAAMIPYADVVMDLAVRQCATGYDPSEAKAFGSYLEDLGFIKCPQPKKVDGTKYTGREFCKYLERANIHNNIVANIGGHHTVAIIDCKVVDHWDSTDGCIGNYWVRQ